MTVPYRHITILAISLILIGAFDGVADKLQFHYSSSVFAKWEGDFWANPRTESWKNKYAHDAEGEVIRPLRPAYFGSTTFLVWTTDAWHLAKELRAATWRSLLVWALVLALSLLHYRLEWWKIAALWLLAWLVQAAGFHLLYTWLLNA